MVDILNDAGIGIIICIFIGYIILSEICEACFGKAFMTFIYCCLAAAVVTNFFGLIIGVISFFLLVIICTQETTEENRIEREFIRESNRRDEHRKIYGDPDEDELTREFRLDDENNENNY